MTRRTAYLLSMLCFAVFLFASIKLAHAQTVTPASPPTDWTFIIAVVVIALIVGAAIWYNKTHPGTLASDWAALVARVTALEGKVVAATTPSPAAPPTPAGKNGVAGVLTIAVTGDAKIDIPAFNAQYFS